MPALKKTSFTGRITFLGQVTAMGENMRARATDRGTLTFEGLVGEDHSGLTRPSCVRVTDQYPKGTEIRNVRQLSIVSAEELAAIADKIGLPMLDPQLLGATMVVEGIPDFTHVPPSSRLQFESGACVTIDMENRPCQLPAREIEKDHEGHGKTFKAAAKNMRGVTAWVERPGDVAVGDRCVLHVPDQPVWAHLDAAREAK